jgi:hypothetical protein
MTPTSKRNLYGGEERGEQKLKQVAVICDNLRLQKM